MDETTPKCGYAKTKEVDIEQKSGAGKFIMKPYILEKIGLAIKEELNQGAMEKNGI